MTEKFWIECTGQTYTALFVISSPSDLDEELFEWIGQAYQFAQSK